MSLTSVSHSDTGQRTFPFLKLATSILVSMTSLLAHTVAQPTKWRFLHKNLNQLVIFVIGLAFT